MPTVTYLVPNGKEVQVEIQAGQTVMEASVRNNLPGTIGECGGELSCATCHVYVDSRWHSQLPEPSDDEHDLLEFTDAYRPESRLACQMTVTDELDGLRVIVAEQ
jgi:2Fe-2S ferredoxin